MEKTKIRLGFSTLMNSSLEKDLSLMNNSNFNTLSLDLSTRPNLNFSEKEKKSLRKIGKKKKIIIHMPYYLPTNTRIDIIFSSVIEYFKKVINFSSEVNARIITFHAGYVEGFKVDTNSLVERISRLYKLTNGTKIVLSIENDDKCNDYPLWNEEVIKNVLNRCTEIKYTLDIGHAYTAGIDILKHIDLVFDKINVVHLHNNCGEDQHKILNGGKINVKPIIQKLAKNKEIFFILENINEKDIIESKKAFEYIIKNEQ